MPKTFSATLADAEGAEFTVRFCVHEPEPDVGVFGALVEIRSVEPERFADEAEARTDELLADAMEWVEYEADEAADHRRALRDEAPQ